MIAASYLQILLALSVTATALALGAFFLVTLFRAVDGEIGLGWIPVGFIGLILTGATWVWLGAGPLN